MKLTVRITRRAEQDLFAIGRYTLKEWSKAQRDEYLRKIIGRINWLAERPRIGKQRGDIAEGYYSFLEGSHVIFYIFDEVNIDIIGIPHQAMDIENYFHSEDD
ncbi:MAG: type II toxin-antitoxin system RelE/ParE family toxin [Pseudomonadales bacterium]|nr:type II toxin-antitoxin system RelE/ParE family toxin [Pseudomonadales bacterium]